MMMKPVASNAASSDTPNTKTCERCGGQIQWDLYHKEHYCLQCGNVLEWSTVFVSLLAPFNSQDIEPGDTYRKTKQEYGRGQNGRRHTSAKTWTLKMRDGAITISYMLSDPTDLYKGRGKYEGQKAIDVIAVDWPTSLSFLPHSNNISIVHHAIRDALGVYPRYLQYLILATRQAQGLQYKARR